MSKSTPSERGFDSAAEDLWDALMSNEPLKKSTAPPPADGNELWDQIRRGKRGRECSERQAAAIWARAAAVCHDTMARVQGQARRRSLLDMVERDVGARRAVLAAQDCQFQAFMAGMLPPRKHSGRRKGSTANGGAL